MTIEVINNTLLPVFLFIFYVSLGSFWLAEAETASETNSTPPDYKAAFGEENDPNPWFDEQKISKSSETTSDEQIPINLASLMIQQLKQAHLRKLCRPLGIASKRQGKWVPTAQMRETIERQAQEYPRKFIQAVQDKLPELAVALTA